MQRMRCMAGVPYEWAAVGGGGGHGAATAKAIQERGCAQEVQ